MQWTFSDGTFNGVGGRPHCLGPPRPVRPEEGERGRGGGKWKGDERGHSQITEKAQTY